MSTSTPGHTVSFYFNPACPWTWVTARWLDCVSGERNLTIEWRSLSLSVLADRDINALRDRWRAGAELSRDALRVMEALRAEGRSERILPLYVGIGERLFTDGTPASAEVLAGAADEAGITDILPAAGDPSWDEAVTRSTQESAELGGPGLGSPVLVIDGRAIFGPIVSSVPPREDALKLWDSLVALNSMDNFFELKRERDSGPDLASASSGVVCEVAL